MNEFDHLALIEELRIDEIDYISGAAEPINDPHRLSGVYPEIDNDPPFPP